jgi:hypothetical protein
LSVNLFSLDVENISSLASEIHRNQYLALLSPHTDIPKYIRRLKCHLGLIYRFDDMPPTIHPELLERISFLRSLTLDGTVFHWGMGSINWIQMDTVMRSTVLRLMHLPTLTHLDIKNFHVSDLFSCTSLKHLSFDCVRITDEPSTFLPSEPDIVTVPRIQEYSVRRSAKCTTRLSAAKLVDGRLVLDFTNLKILFISLEMEEDIEAAPT